MSNITQKNLVECILGGTDCTFYFHVFPLYPGEQYTEIHANRKIIDNASEYLKNKFETYKRSALEIRDVKPAIFKMILEHVYTGKLPSTLTQELVFEMYRAAHNYEFKATTDSLTLYMIKQLNAKKVEELLSYLNFALKNYIIPLQRFLEKIIESNADLILAKPAFFRTHPRIINWVFSLNELNIDEWELIRVAEKYKTINKNVGRYVIGGQIQPAINKIRFLSCTVADINGTTFLSKEEKKCLILVVTENAPDKSVPMYLSRKRIGRCKAPPQIICEDEGLSKLYEEGKIKLGTYKGSKYFVMQNGKIVGAVDDSGKAVPCDFQTLTPMKDLGPDSGKNKRVCGGIEKTVLFYRENKQILVKKKSDPSSNRGKENDENAATETLRKLSLK